MIPPGVIEETLAPVADITSVNGAAAQPAEPAVLHVAAPVDGGVPRYAAGLVRDQLERGWRVGVASPPGGDLEMLLEASEAVLLPWSAERDPGPSTWPEAVRLGRIIREFAPDIVHLHSSKAGLAGRLAIRGRLPTVFQPNAWSFEAVAGPLRSLAAAWERFAARWTDVIVCVSEAERARGAEELDAAWRVVVTGIDLDAFPEATAADRRAARARLSLGAGPLVVCVGRVCRQKGQDVLLEAWPSVVDRVPDAELVLVGDGPDAEQLARSAPPGVTFAGARTDVGTWLAAADVVALPSRWEGMSIVMLEAMAHGRSLVATDVDGAREALGDAVGAIVPIEDAPALSAALATRLANPRRTAAEGRDARRRAEAFHDARMTADSIARVYADVVRARTDVVPHVAGVPAS